MAYTGVQERNRRVDREATRADIEMSSGHGSFNNFYQEELLKDARRPAREIHPEMYVPKKITQHSSSMWDMDEENVYKNRKERTHEFFEQHKYYMEGNLEKRDRDELN